MTSLLDMYNLRARFIPAVIGIAPAIALAAIAISWTTVTLPQVIATLAIGILFIVAADLARRMGKKTERKLFASTDGKPIIQQLRHMDATFDGATKNRYRNFLASQLNELPPTAECEKSNTVASNGFYDRCGIWLRERTRDKSKFNLLFEENITYGFRRNLYGLKVPGLLLNILVVIACIFLLSPYGGILIKTTRNELFTVFIIALIHAIYLLFFVTKKSVIEAAKQYSEQLIKSCDIFIQVDTFNSKVAN